MSDFLCSIDIGSSVIRAVVARIVGPGQLEVTGVGSSPSKGVKNGVVINIDATLGSVTEAIREAELMSGLALDEAIVNITGKHLHGGNSRGVVAITNKERMIRHSDVLRVIEGAQNIRIPADQEIIHVLSREFTVDDQNGVKDPVGMTGVRLEAEVHIVTASASALSNMNRALVGSGIRVSDGVINSLAASEAVLTEGEKDLGVALVDIGGGTTDLIVFIDGGVYHTAVLPVGGNHVTHDLSIGLRIPVDQAEIIKKSYGASMASLVDPTERIEIQGIQGRPSRWVLRQQIAEFIEPRMTEIFELVDAELVRNGKKKYLAGGVVLTGGGTLIEGSLRLAEEVFNLSVSPGYPTGFEGFQDRVGGPEFAVSLGMLRYGAREIGGSFDFSEKKMEASDEGFFNRLKNWISQNL